MTKKSHEVKSHRQRYSRYRFSNVIINNKLKNILDMLKNLVSKIENKNYEPSYNDVIKFLIKDYLKKDSEYKTKSFSFTTPTRNTSFTHIRKTKSTSFTFEN